MTMMSSTPCRRVFFVSVTQVQDNDEHDLSLCFFLLVIQAQWVFIFFLVLEKNLFCFVVFATLVDANSKKQKLLENKSEFQLNWQMAWEVS